MRELPQGIYEQLLNEELQTFLDENPDVQARLCAVEEAVAPHSYAHYLRQIVQQAFRITKTNNRVEVLNRLIDLLASEEGLEFLQKRRLLNVDKDLLIEVGSEEHPLPRPTTPLSISSLLTGQGEDPPLEHELRAEMMTVNQLDLLVSFIKWSGLRLLIPAFEALRDRNVPVRILSTSYMGASDPVALEWLAKQPNIEVRVSYDTKGTRLHAKAYHFIRKSGYSTAYIGSANMSHSAMTQGLEWTVKVTEQDMPHILERFIAEFASYWESDEFEAFDCTRFREAIKRVRTLQDDGVPFFAEITARPFQQRILEALEAERQRGYMRNLVVAATGTGKTVISALDYKRISEQQGNRLPLLFVAHRKEILEQAMGCFRTVLRDQNFGELLVDGKTPIEWKHVFASVQSLNRQQPWERLGVNYFRYVIIDEVHHGAADSYRQILEYLKPEILLGLTATPERMDGSSILPDFRGRFAAEIRLPEALEEKLLCPFHYFGVSDSADLSDDRFWRNGRYDANALEEHFIGDHFAARQRVDTIVGALKRYQPELEGVKGVGFCVGVRHACYMAACFNEIEISSASLTGNTPGEERSELLRRFRQGELTFLFTVDVLSEGVDVPDINLVLFLRPTDSLTVFLQQLGRGLRHAPGKDCLTVLDFVGQTHRKYRLDTKYAALLSRGRQRIDREIENDFPHLPPGCSIQLERIARDRILQKVRSVLNDLNHFISETIRTWEQDTDRPLTFGNFIEETGLSPVEILSRNTWSEWKSRARKSLPPTDRDLGMGRKALSRIALRTDPELLQAIEDLQPDSVRDERQAVALHYLLWGKKASAVGVRSVEESFQKWRDNISLVADGAEIAYWRRSTTSIPTQSIQLPIPCSLRLHAAYGSAEIKAALGLATLDSSGMTGLGVMLNKEIKCYIHLVTFRKSEGDFSPTTRYQDYPISRTQLHWESQSTTTQESVTGQNYIHFKERGYTILFFARMEKRIERETSPFLFLGPAEALLSYSGNRPISMVWKLEYPMPASLFEEARAV